jgi:hypothetical protein
VTTFKPMVGDLFMVAFKNGDQSWRECVFEALDVDDRITIAKIVAGISWTDDPKVFTNEKMNYYETSHERAVLLGMKTEQ